ncbi:tetratricopeptide repeat protein [Shewanella hanedai]|uniref:Tetratricopeptide repeat protein n=1 Tax=Shewanella hanedai TaxID=25 RepID=A0A553JLQ7_SHEHA|nr:tetratricopeptide repeat protein [Shewanella hanedai]TRY13388.1 tetratricopeptide repeat protein [Shewanella hanedai]
MNAKRRIPLSLCCLLTVLSLANANAQVPFDKGSDNGMDLGTVKLVLDKPIWLISSNTPLSVKQEARLDPSEQSLAQKLRPALDKKEYKTALALLEAHSSDKKSAALWQVTGQVNMAMSRWKQAESAFLQAIKVQPGLARSHRSLAALYIKQSTYDKAQQHIRSALALGQQDAQLFGQLAYINLQNSSPWSAINGYQQALLLEPDSRQWQQGLMFALLEAKHFQPAQALVEELLVKRPKDKALWLHRSQISMELGQLDKALSSLEVALRLGDTTAENLLLSAQLHLKQGSVEQSVKRLTQALKSSNVSFEQVASSIEWLAHYGYLTQANKVIKGVSTRGMSARDKGQFYGVKGKIAAQMHSSDKALGYYLKAIKFSPDNGELLLALAEHYRTKSEFGRAELYYLRAEVSADVRVQALVGHAQLAIDQALYSQAITYLNKALQQSPERRDLARNIKVLERLVSQNG